MTILTKILLPAIFIALFYFPFFIIPLIPHGLQPYRFVLPHFCEHIDPRLPTFLKPYSPCTGEANASSQIERTLALLKPDVYPSRKEELLQAVRDSGLAIVEEKEIHLTPQQAEILYEEHKARPFYKDLTIRMSAAPVYAMVLSGPDAIRRWRDLLGPTNPVEARLTASQSIRAVFGTNIDHNAVHGSDSSQTAAREIAILFA